MKNTKTNRTEKTVKIERLKNLPEKIAKQITKSKEEIEKALEGR